MDYSKLNEKVRNPENPSTPPKDVQKWENDGGGIVEAQKSKLTPPKTFWEKLKSVFLPQNDMTNFPH